MTLNTAARPFDEENAAKPQTAVFVTLAFLLLINAIAQQVSQKHTHTHTKIIKINPSDLVAQCQYFIGLPSASGNSCLQIQLTKQSKNIKEGLKNQMQTKMK